MKIVMTQLPKREKLYLVEFLILNEKMLFASCKLKHEAAGHAIMQAVRSRTVIASLQICLGVQLHIELGSRFFIETVHELGFCTFSQKVQGPELQCLLKVKENLS